MKKALLSVVAAGALVAGAVSQAEAATVRIRICQGATCVDFGPGTPSFTANNVVVGDYQIVSVNGSSFESSAFSQSATVSNDVRRIGNTSDAPLDIWVNATGYLLPDPGGFPFQIVDTLAATALPPEVHDVTATYRSWFSPGIVLMPPGNTPPVGTATALIQCDPSPSSCNVDGVPILVPGAIPYTLTTRTQWFIQKGDPHLHGSTGRTVVTVVPEPMSLLLMGSGLVGIGASMRRRRANKQ